MSKSILFDTVFYMCNSLCNYNCIFCRSHLRTLPDDDKGLNPELFERVISRAQVVNVSACTGETLLMPWFPEMVEILARHGKEFALTTNGSPLNTQNIELLRGSTLNMLSISINSLDRDTYKTLTGGAKLSIVLDNVEHMFASNPKYKVQFTFVVSALNMKELKSFVDYGRDHKSHVIFYPLTPVISDYDSKLIVTDSQENVARLKEAERYAVEQGVSLASFTLKNDNGTLVNTLSEEYLADKIKKCFVPFTKLYVNSSGQVYQCDWTERGKCMGDLSLESVDELWNNDNFKELRQCVRNGNIRHCKLCRIWG